MNLFRLFLIALLVGSIVPCIAFGNESRLRGTVGAGVGRHYGGIGISLARPILHGWGITAGLGYGLYDQVGWEIGTQIYTRLGTERLIARATLQYGLEGHLKQNVDGEETYVDSYNGFGVGLGLGFQFSNRWWVVADVWNGLTDPPDPWQSEGFSPHPSLGVVYGTW